MTFGAYIKQSRQFWGLSQRDLAALLPISAQYYNDIESGRRDAPSDALILQLADELCMNSDVLFYAAGRIAPDLRSASPVVARKALRCFREAMAVRGTGG